MHSGPFARFGNVGHGNVGREAAWLKKPGFDAPEAHDSSIPQDRSGHPIAHRFTKAIPSSQCMVCHMHQPNSFLNTYYGYQMWSYETDGEHMWPEQQRAKSIAEQFEILDRNPEGAAMRGKWGDRTFLERVAEDINPKLQHTQFADYHGHGWIFRAVFKTDRKGNLLDRDGNIIPYDKPDKFAGVIPELGQGADGRRATGPRPRVLRAAAGAAGSFEGHSRRSRHALRRLSLCAGRARRHAPVFGVPGGDPDSVPGLPRHDRRGDRLPAVWSGCQT